MIDHVLLERTLRAVDWLSGVRRAWVPSARVLDAAMGLHVGNLEDRLRLHPWWSDPSTTPLVALIDLIRRGLVEGRGHHGDGFDAPADPTYSECRRVDRPLAEVLAASAAIAKPGETVTMFDPRRLVLDDGLGPLRLGARIPTALDRPWSLRRDNERDWVLCLDGHDVACILQIDGIVAMIAPCVMGVRAAPGVTNGESGAALRARWSDDLQGGRHRVWHREHPATIVVMHDWVMWLEAWARDHLIRIWIRWDAGVEPEPLRFRVTCDGVVVLDPNAESAGDHEVISRNRPGYVSLPPPPPPAGPVDLGPLPNKRCKLTIVALDPRSRVAPVSLDVRTGDLNIVVRLRYR